MPDLFCHTISGYILLRPKWKHFFIPSVFLLGCIFPDLIRGPLLIFSNFFNLDGRYTFPLLILHSPLPLFFQAWFFSQFFQESIRQKVLRNLLAGIILHLILDSCQKAYHISYLWLFPFSFENPIKGLWWADDALIITLTFIISGLIVFLIRKKDT